MIEKTVPTIMKNQRPTIAWRIWRTASRRLSPTKRFTAAPCWPNVLDRRMHETDSVSSVTAESSASDFWVSLLTSRRILPTRKVRYMKNGSIPSESAVSRQSMMNMAMTVLIAMARFEVSEDAVSVTTPWMPPTSLARRLWISPVLVSVKNRSGMRWRWV